MTSLEPPIRLQGFEGFDSGTKGPGVASRKIYGRHMALSDNTEYPRPVINKPPALTRDYNKAPNIWALKGGGLLIMGLH